MTASSSDALVFCGATGDLAYKKIFPAPLAMDARVGRDPESVRAENLRLFHAMRPVDPTCLVRGQFRDYHDEKSVTAVPKDVLAQITAQIPVGRLGQPEDIGRVMVFLASDVAGFITGATFSANGGMHMN